MEGKPIPAIEEVIVTPANKRFRSLIQELFSLVDELYEENDRLAKEHELVEGLQSKVDVLTQELGELQSTLIWLSSRKLTGESVPELRSEIRRVVADALKGKKILDESIVESSKTSEDCKSEDDE